MTQTKTQPTLRRRSVLKAFFGLPVAVLAAGTGLKGSHAIAPSRDVVRQSELQALIDADPRHRAAIGAIRKRMRDGAIVEQGKISVKSDSEVEYPLEWAAQPIGGFYASGLDIAW